MQILITLSSNDPEVKWNAVRFGNFLLNEGEDVTLFLKAGAVDLYAGDSEAFPIAKQAKVFALSEGVLVAWGKCLSIHGVDVSEYVKLSSMKFLYAEMKKADRILNY